MKDQFRFLLFVFLLVPFFDLQTPMHSIGERDTENKRKKQNGYHICAVKSLQQEIPRHTDTICCIAGGENPRTSPKIMREQKAGTVGQEVKGVKGTKKMQLLTTCFEHIKVHIVVISYLIS